MRRTTERHSLVEWPLVAGRPLGWELSPGVIVGPVLRQQNGDAERPGGLEIEDQLDFRGKLHDGEVSRLLSDFVEIQRDELAIARP